MVDHGSHMNAIWGLKYKHRWDAHMLCWWSAALTVTNRGQHLLCGFPPAGVGKECQPPERGRYLAELCFIEWKSSKFALKTAPVTCGGIFKIFQDGEEENNRAQMKHDGKWGMKGSQRVKMEKEEKIRERKYFCLLCPFLHDIVALCPILFSPLCLSSRFKLDVSDSKNTSQQIGCPFNIMTPAVWGGCTHMAHGKWSKVPSLMSGFGPKKR